MEMIGMKYFRQFSKADRIWSIAFAFLIYSQNPTDVQAAPLVDLQGSAPEQALITLEVTKPASTNRAVITLTTYDADFPDEGELIINGNTPVALFGDTATNANDRKSANIILNTPAAYWRNGNNSLLFRHTRTAGYAINGINVAFDYQTANTAPTISGSPADSVQAGNAYSFRPSASDPDGDILKFYIVNKPSWADFDSTTGRLSGMPAINDVGVYDYIYIYVLDGKSGALLSPFSITVYGTGQTNGNFTVSWTAPVARSDGNPLAMSEIAGYTLYYGDSANNYSQSLDINDAYTNSVTVSELTAGTYYVVLTTRDADGRESAYSDMVSKVVR